jgi:hypothetical protein
MLLVEGEKWFSPQCEEVSYMYSVMKKVGSRSTVVQQFNSISEARDYLTKENDKNYVPAAKVGRVYGSVGIWCPSTASSGLLNRQTKSYQKSLYNPACESNLYIQYSTEVIPFPTQSKTVEPVMTDSFKEVVNA